MLGSRMQSTVDHQHRARLRGEIRPRPVLEESARFDDSGGLAGDVEDAVRLHVEVAGARVRVGAHQLAAVLDIEADRSVIGTEHPGVGCEEETGSIFAERVRQRGQIAVRFAVGSFPEEPYDLAPQVYLAYRIMDFFVQDDATGRGLGKS